MYRKPPLFTTITRITVIEDGKTSQSQDYQWDQGEASGSNNSNGNGFDESSEGESPETGIKLAGVKRKLLDEVIVIDGDDENSILSRRSKRLVENDSQVILIETDEEDDENSFTSEEYVSLDDESYHTESDSEDMEGTRRRIKTKITPISEHSLHLNGDLPSEIAKLIAQSKELLKRRKTMSTNSEASADDHSSPPSSTAPSLSGKSNGRNFARRTRELSSGLYLPNIETISNAALAASSAARITTAASNFSPLRTSCTSSAVPTPTRPSPSTTPVHQFSSTPTSPKAGSSGVAPMEIDAVKAYIVKDSDSGMDLDYSNRNRDRSNNGIKKGRFSWPSKNPALFSRMKPCKERSYEYVRSKQYISDCFEACEGSQVKKVYMNEWQKYLVTGEGKAKPLSSLASSSSTDQLGDNGYKWPKTRKPLDSISISDDEGDDNGSHTITNFNSGNSSDGDAEKDDADMATDGDKSTDNSARRFEAFVIIDHPGEVPIVTTRPRLQRKNLTRGS